MPRYAYKIVFVVLVLLCSESFSEMRPVPDSIKDRINDESTILSVEEVYSIQKIVWGDSSQDAEEATIRPKDSLFDTHVNPLMISAQILGQNVLVWAWDYYVLKKNYARTGVSYWKRNFREGFKWDHNHWAINFYGHPYQGSFYYASARGAGYGFYSSMLFAALGSSTWEMFCEREYPAPNDLISTTIAGSVFGEVLYRVARMFYNRPGTPWYRQLTAMAIEPADFLQRKAFGDRDFYTGFPPIDFSVAAGFGSRFGSDYRFGGENADELDADWNDHHGMFALFLEYGLPYAKVRRPFDYFKLDVLGEGGMEGNVLQMDVMGKLVNLGMHGFGHWLDFSVNLDYDTFYGDLATVSTLSLGGAMDLALWLTHKTRFRIMNQLYWIMLGSADMGYDDIIKEFHPEYNPDKDSYQYNSGIKYSLMLEIIYKRKWRLYDEVTIDAMKTIEGSTPDYGVTGWDFLLLNNVALEYSFFSWLDVGYRLDTYIKMAAYSSEMAEPMSRRIFTYTLYLKFHLLRP